MGTLIERKNNLLSQSHIYDGRLRFNNSLISERKHGLGSLTRRKEERKGNLEVSQKKYNKIKDINAYFDKKIMLIMGIPIYALASCSVIFSSLNFLIGALCIAIPFYGCRLATRIIERKRAKRLKEDTEALANLEEIINDVTRDLEGLNKERKSIMARKNIVDEGIKEIDEYIASLPDYLENTEEQSLENNQTLDTPTPPSL